jgi:hypothetical protein
MTSERNGDPNGHRLFHAMVLMGGSLALGCGGMSNETAGDDGVGGSGASPGSGGSATSGTGGTTSGGAGGSGSTTGVGGNAGTISIPTAGTSSIPVDPPNCPATQWDCGDTGFYCAGDNYQLPDGSGCRCDDTRPVSAGDCAPGTAFVCHAAGMSADGHVLPQVAPFGCACVADTTGCDTECNQVAPSSGTCTEISGPSVNAVLCNCAVIVLR